MAVEKGRKVIQVTLPALSLVLIGRSRGSIRKRTIGVVGVVASSG